MSSYKGSGCSKPRLQSQPEGRQPGFSSLGSSEYLNIFSLLPRGNEAYACCHSQSVSHTYNF